MKFSQTSVLIAALLMPFQAAFANTPNTPLVGQAAKQGVSFNQLAAQCGSSVHPDTLQAVARVESQFNPYAIGVVKGALKSQPKTHAQAVAAAKMLHAQGRNFSMGLMQVNRYNLKTYGLDYESVFHPCKNIQAGAAILADCFKRAGSKGQTDLHRAFSCYYSGNFRTGFRADFKGQPPYVVKILNAARENNHQQLLAYAVPAVNPNHAVAAPTRANRTAKTAPVKATVVSGSTRQASTSLKQRNDTSNDVPTNESANIQAAEPPKPRPTWDVFGEF